MAGLPAAVNVNPGVREVTIDGVSVPALCRELEELGADVVGLNCSLGPDTMIPIMRKVKDACNVKLLISELKNFRNFVIE